MTATSLYGGPVLYNEGEHAADDPLSADVGLVLANNALHWADQAGCVRINWPPDDAGTYYDDGLGESIYKLVSRPFPPFPMFLKEDGSTYGLRVRLAGYSPDATSVDFKVILAPVGGTGAWVNQSQGNTATFSTSSSTNAWRTQTGGIDLLVLDTSMVQARDLLVRSNYGASYGGDKATLRVILCELAVYTRHNTIFPTPARLTGLYAAEYHG